MSGLAVTERESTAPLSVRVVDMAANLLAGRGSTRRRFLYRLAVIGSALAVDPLRFITRPTPAYASVCGSGTGCGAGWSVFCCTINKGANTCPDGSFVAGWWKVSASSFCLGSPRYYIDCNRTPGSSCNCRCNSIGCDHRRVCCNVFRYGQCNTQIAGVTEVVCRLITCTPPWEWDPSCGRTVRTDEETRSHNSGCLPGPNPTRIEIKYQDLGLVGSVLGRPVSRERAAPYDGRRRSYDRGLIYWHRRTGAHEVHGPIAKRYVAFDAAAGPLGYPTTDTLAVRDGSGSYSRFQHGAIYHRNGTAARAVFARPDTRYWELGGPRGRLGYPTTSTIDAGPGKVTYFANGAIYHSSATPPVEVTGAVLALYRDRGGPQDSSLGFPVAPAEVFADGGRIQRFQRGVIGGPAADRVFLVRPVIAEAYEGQGAAEGSWGYPTSSSERPEGADQGLQSRFQTVMAYWSAANGVHWLHGPILRRYREEGGPAGRLGFPVTNIATLSSGVQRARFEDGAITYDPVTGTTHVDRSPKTP